MNSYGDEFFLLFLSFFGHMHSVVFLSGFFMAIQRAAHLGVLFWFQGYVITKGFLLACNDDFTGTRG